MSWEPRLYQWTACALAMVFLHTSLRAFFGRATLPSTMRRLTQGQHCFLWVTVNCRHPHISSWNPTWRLYLVHTTWHPSLKLSPHPASPPFQGICSPPPRCCWWPLKAPRSPPSLPPPWILLIQLCS